MQKALVYSGPGAGSRSVNSAVDALRRSLRSERVQVGTIDAQSVVRGGWQEHCLCFIMPGGADVPYCRELGIQGIDMIRSWVEEDGGFYLGLCAGAYFASGKVVFERGSALEVIGERFLKFYKGTACGAVYPGFCYETERGAVAAPIRYLKWETSVDGQGGICADVQWDTCSDYVNGGPYWLCQNDPNEILRINSVHPVLDNVDILATYPEKNHAVSAMKCTVGKGSAVLCSSHPELDSALFLHGNLNAISDHLENKTGNNADAPHYYTDVYLQHVQGLVKELDANKTKRQGLWKLLLAAGGLKNYLHE
jgi:biotin--protein ligase